MIDITLLSGAIVVFFARVNLLIADFVVVLRYYCFYLPIYVYIIITRVRVSLLKLVQSRHEVEFQF